MAHLLGGTPPVQADVTGPGIHLVVLSGAAAIAAALIAPTLAPVVAAAWLVGLASRVRFAVSGGGTPPLSARELQEWAAYYRIEPWGDERADMRAALISSVIANANRDPKKRRRPYELRDFLLKFGPPQRRDPEDLLASVEILNAAFGGRDLRQGG